MTSEAEKASVPTDADLRSDVLAITNSSEITLPLAARQAMCLTRRCAISLSMATAVAPLLHGESAR